MYVFTVTCCHANNRSLVHATVTTLDTNDDKKLDLDEMKAGLATLEATMDKVWWAVERFEYKLVPLGVLLPGQHSFLGIQSVAVSGIHIGFHCRSSGAAGMWVGCRCKCFPRTIFPLLPCYPRRAWTVCHFAQLTWLFDWVALTCCCVATLPAYCLCRRRPS